RTGTVVRPSICRRKDFADHVDAIWSECDCDSARYVIGDKEGMSVVKNGQIRVDGGYATLASDRNQQVGSVALLYPRKTIRASSEGYLPDLWAGFDSYRDRLLAILTQVKFGPGLRFFLDPLAHPLRI